MVIPGVHELSTFCSSVSKLVNCWDTKGASEVWIKYSEESIFGSAITAAFHAIRRDNEEAIRIGKGFLKAAIRLIFLGGLLSEIPLFKELDAYGRRFGNRITKKDRGSSFQCCKYDWKKTITQLIQVGVGVGIGIGASYAAAALNPFVPNQWSYFLSSLVFSVIGNGVDQVIGILSKSRNCLDFDWGKIVAALLKGAICGGVIKAIRDQSNRALNIETGCVAGVEFEVFLAAEAVEVAEAVSGAAIDPTGAAINPTGAHIDPTGAPDIEAAEAIEGTDEAVEGAVESVISPHNSPPSSTKSQYHEEDERKSSKSSSSSLKSKKMKVTKPKKKAKKEKKAEKENKEKKKKKKKEKQEKNNEESTA